MAEEAERRRQTDICQYHTNDHAVISDLRDAVKIIIEGQQDMRASLIQLTEAFKNMERIELRLEKIEDRRRSDREKRDNEIAELKTFMNRAMGWAAAIALIGGILIKFLGV